MHDKVFGQMEYDWQWQKPYVIQLWGRRYDIKCVACAGPGEEISDAQRDSYIRIERHKQAVEQKAADMLQRYYTQLGGTDSVAEHVSPEGLLYREDGCVALICDCDWDADGGVAVVLYPKLEVGGQDILL